MWTPLESLHYDPVPVHTNIHLSLQWGGPPTFQTSTRRSDLSYNRLEDYK